MSDKEKIRAEIERLLNKEWKWGSSIEAKFRCEADRELLEFIDSLPEEPASKELDEEIEKYLDHNYYIDEEGIVCDRSHPSLEYCEDKFRKDAHHFANWQKEQMIDKACEWLHDWTYFSVDELTGSLNDDDLVKRFKEAMEDEK